MLSKTSSVLYTYENEAAHRETYYKGLKKAYESKYGPIDPNAPPTLPPPNFCVRGDACTRKASSDPSDPEKHQQPCPQKLNGKIFGIGERNCTGHIYNCDSTYICPRWEDHLTDGGCGHRYAIKDKTKHQWTYGTCPDRHAYWACDSKKHKRTIFSCGHHDYKCKPLTKAVRDVHAYKYCKWCKAWLPVCKSYVYDCNGSYSGHSFNSNIENELNDTGNDGDTTSNPVCSRDGCNTKITAQNESEHAFVTCAGCDVGYYNCDSAAVYAHAWVSCKRGGCPRSTGTGESGLFRIRRCKGNPSGINNPFSCVGGLPHLLR